jgi:hypothetical protein
LHRKLGLLGAELGDLVRNCQHLVQKQCFKHFKLSMPALTHIPPHGFQIELVFLDFDFDIARGNNLSH